MSNRSSPSSYPVVVGFSMLMALAAMFALMPPAFAQSGDPAAGKKVSDFVCKKCHDVSGSDKPRNPPGGAPSFFESAQKAETTEKFLHRFLTFPHGRMNIVQISGKEVDDVVAYIMSMKRE